MNDERKQHRCYSCDGTGQEPSCTCQQPDCDRCDRGDTDTCITCAGMGWL